MTPDSLKDSALLLGEHSRLKLLWALLDRRSYTAGELALAGELSAPSASMHLARLLEAGWVSVTRQGRHRYYAIADDAVAHAVEAVGAIRHEVAACRSPKRRKSDPSTQHARSCYGHLAGEVAVAFWNALLERRWMHRDDGRFILGAEGQAGLSGLIECSRSDSILNAGLKPCMDWTERTFHLGGGLGVRVFHALQARGWIRQMPRSRAVVFSPGKEGALVRLAFADAPT
jgi:DNA-binding transcriptional ArsR family regulator